MQPKKEDLIELLNSAPKKSLSDLEKQFILIIMEKSKVQREGAMSIVNKGFFAFFVVLGVIYWARENNLMQQLYLNMLFVFGLIVMVLSLVSYHSVVKKEELLLDRLLDNYLK